MAQATRDDERRGSSEEREGRERVVRGGEMRGRTIHRMEVVQQAKIHALV